MAALPMGHDIRTHRVRARTRAGTEWDDRTSRLRCQREVLIAKSGGSADTIDRDDDDRDIQGMAGLIGNHGRSGDRVALHFGWLFPVDRQPRNNDDRNLVLSLLMRYVGVGNYETEVILTRSCGHPIDDSLARVQLESWRKIAVDAAPGVGRKSTLHDEW